MLNINFEDLTGLKKAAIFLVAIGSKAAAQVYKHLSEEEVERLSAEIARLESVPSSTLNEVNQEFYQMVLAHQYIAAGGLSFAQEALVDQLIAAFPAPEPLAPVAGARPPPV